MSTQLRLVDTPEPTPRRRGGRARVATPARSRRVHWSTDWRLDEGTRRAGRAGVAAARQALDRARRPDADLRRAS